jgi:hypothetical protein
VPSGSQTRPKVPSVHAVLSSASVFPTAPSSTVGGSTEHPAWAASKNAVMANGKTCRMVVLPMVGSPRPVPSGGTARRRFRNLAWGDLATCTHPGRSGSEAHTRHCTPRNATSWSTGSRMPRCTSRCPGGRRRCLTRKRTHPCTARRMPRNGSHWRSGPHRRCHTEPSPWDTRRLLPGRLFPRGRFGRTLHSEMRWRTGPRRPRRTRRWVGDRKLRTCPGHRPVRPDRRCRTSRSGPGPPCQHA